MDNGWYSRLFLVLGFVGLAGYFLYPSYYYFYEATDEQRDSHEQFCEAMPSWMTCSKFSLGLDLQGGIHLVMGVGVEKAVEQRLDRLADSLDEGMKEEGIKFTKVVRPRGLLEIQVGFEPGQDRSQFETYLRTDFWQLEAITREDTGYTLALVAERDEEVRRSAVEQTIKSLRNRADQFGVTEPTIARRGASNILIQLPGVKDPKRALDMIGRTAQLEFKIVEAEASSIFVGIDPAELPEGVVARQNTFSGPGGKSVVDNYFELPLLQKEAVRKLLESKIDNEKMIAFGETSSNQEGFLRTYLLTAKAGITGDYLVDARVNQNPDLPSDYHVSMTFDQKGARIFENLTEANKKRNMAIVLDDVVSSAPQIQDRIAGGSAMITLGSSGDTRKKFQEATDLSLVLKAGALPAPVEIREKRQVGKTLGAESVDSGKMAITVGILMVLIFMTFYYRGSGLIANVALVLNIFFVLAVLAMFEATLTLPGMAGIVLTIGMAVDANVIIFERIVEELRIGKTPRAAIDSGYGKAFSTIMDANITTLIAGVVLMQYGSGPVRGFAVTLIIGIICSVFTAIVVTRLIFDFMSSRRRLESLSI
ncbi:MAG: protein translocase subunit SecD [Deltaproteobacteria bacterium]|nr:protein translocase subunit SecD [Deltaproteobacteria bacterium]